MDEVPECDKVYAHAFKGVNDCFLFETNAV